MLKIDSEKSDFTTQATVFISDEGISAYVNFNQLILCLKERYSGKLSLNSQESCGTILINGARLGEYYVVPVLHQTLQDEALQNIHS